MATEKRLDLVEREAIKDAIGFMNLHFLGHGENKSVLDSINEVPSVDAVQVVRCKDCKYFSTYDHLHRDYWCDIMRDNSVVPDFYCAAGERKDND